MSCKHDATVTLFLPANEKLYNIKFCKILEETVISNIGKLRKISERKMRFEVTTLRGQGRKASFRSSVMTSHVVHRSFLIQCQFLPYKIQKDVTNSHYFKL